MRVKCVNSDRPGEEYSFYTGVGFVKPGDAFTIAGVRKLNPNWRWYKPWVKKTLKELQVYTVIGVSK